jgi:hypothetical protein
MGLIATLARTYYKFGPPLTHASLSREPCLSPPPCLAGRIVSVQGQFVG